MAQVSPSAKSTVSVTFTAAEKRTLELRAVAAGQTLDEYIRERVVAEAGAEDQIFRFLSDELSRSADEAQQAIAELDRQRANALEDSATSYEAKRARIVKEVRDAFTHRELGALVRLFESALNAGMGTVSGRCSGSEDADRRS